MTEASDFDDDEDFGLQGPGGDSREEEMPEAHSSEQAAAGAVETRNALPTEQAEAEEEEDDIYGDIGGGSAIVPFDQNATPAASDAELDAAKQQQADRQNSGSLAESRQNTPPLTQEGRQKPGQKQLPKRLADTTVVYIGELQWWTSDADLEAACCECGEVAEVTFFEDKASGKSKGYALVKFKTKEAANLCRQVVHGTEINGRKCVVTFSSNSSAATAAAKAGRKPPSDADAGSRTQQVQGYGRAWDSSQQASGRRMQMPPMPPWPGGGMMGVAPNGLPMPGAGMAGMGMPFMGMMNARGSAGEGTSRDFKRRRY